MDELIKKKMEIAKRAGELEKEINSFVELAKRIEHKAAINEGLSVQIHDYSNSSTTLRSTAIEPAGGKYLHDCILGYLDCRIQERTTELNELIKVLA